MSTTATSSVFTVKQVYTSRDVYSWQVQRVGGKRFSYGGPKKTDAIAKAKKMAQAVGGVVEVYTANGLFQHSYDYAS